MKIPFSVLYFSSDDTFFFYWRTGLGTERYHCRRQKLYFSLSSSACMYVTESLLCGGASQRHGSLPLYALFIFKTVFGRSVSCIVRNS
jgi:hypothetical protein